MCYDVMILLVSDYLRGALIDRDCPQLDSLRCTYRAGFLFGIRFSGRTGG